MALYAKPLEDLITELSRLPGIGPKSAQRIAFHILRGEDEAAITLADAIRDMKGSLRTCTRCFNFSEGELCDICSDAKRDESVICVVEQPSDIVPIEKSRSFRGLYHVLGGALSPLDGIAPDHLRLEELFRRIGEEDVREVLVATNPNLEGEATALFISEKVKPSGVRVTRIASGLPVGSDLEYADELTLGKAIEGRREL